MDRNDIPFRVLSAGTPFQFCFTLGKEGRGMERKGMSQGRLQAYALMQTASKNVRGKIQLSGRVAV
jgi:hypothetical protein